MRREADKWGREGAHVWHERWGDYYDSRGSVSKWTDKWAESRGLSGGRAEWGEKWDDRFDASGAGERRGESWSVAEDGRQFHQWWNEDHTGACALVLSFLSKLAPSFP